MVLHAGSLRKQIVASYPTAATAMANSVGTLAISGPTQRAADADLRLCTPTIARAVTCVMFSASQYYFKMSRYLGTLLKSENYDQHF